MKSYYWYAGDAGGEPRELTEFVFRLHGNGVNPRSFKAREVADIITHLENAFKTYAESKEGKKGDDLSMSLVSIKDESNSLGFVSFGKFAKQFAAAFLALTTALTAQDYTGIPTRSIEELQAVQKIIRAKECVGDFVVGGEVVSSITPNTHIAVEAAALIRGETVLYGEVTRVGGNKSHPRARIELDTGQIITCDVSSHLARVLAQHLYSGVALKGKAAWSIEDYQVLDFRIEDVSPYTPPLAQNSFGTLRGLLGPYWDKIDDPGQFLNG